MSHIFEALQRSAADTSGLAPDPNVFPGQFLGAAEKAEDSFFEVQSVALFPKPENRLVTLTHPESLGAEKFRFLAVKLRQLQSNRGLKRLLITSTIPEEGKSLIAANLAFTLARRQPKVLLVDGDMRRPSLSDLLGVDRHREGLSDFLLSGERHLKNILRLDVAGPYFFPAGSPPENPLELMQLSKFGELLDQFTRAFDWVIIDSPPVLPLADTTVWAKTADGILLVVREGKTEKTHLKRGMEILGTTKLLGTVLNSCSITDHSNYYARYQPTPRPSADTGKNSG